MALGQGDKKQLYHVVEYGTLFSQDFIKMKFPRQIEKYISVKFHHNIAPLKIILKLNNDQPLTACYLECSFLRIGSKYVWSTNNYITKKCVSAVLRKSRLPPSVSSVVQNNWLLM